MDLIKFGNYLVNLRNKYQLTQNELGELICVTPQAISKWERGIGIPDLSLLFLLANFFKLKIDSFITFIEEPLNENYDFDVNKLGLTIRVLRKSKKINQNKLAELCNVTFQSVSKWEVGEATPSLENLIILCEYFQISLDELFHYVPYQKYLKSRNLKGGFIGVLTIFVCLFAIIPIINMTKDNSGMAPPTSGTNPNTPSSNEDGTSSSTSSFEYEEKHETKYEYLTYEN